MRRRLALATAAAVASTLVLTLLLLHLGDRASAEGSVVTVQSGGGHTCALITDSRVLCWGANGSGQLGMGSTTDSSVPVEVKTCEQGPGLAGVGPPPSCCPISLSETAGTSHCRTLNHITAVTSGFTHTCALTAAGTVLCWGNNSSGQLGNGSFVSSTVAIDVCQPAPIILSGSHAGVLATATPTPTPTPSSCCPPVVISGSGAGGLSPRVTLPTCEPLTNVIAISASGTHTCALKRDTTVWCWGRDDFGQLGNGFFTDSPLPVEVCSGGPIILSAGAAGSCPGLTGVSAIAAGGNHTCALMQDSGIFCWGDNASGQLGNGTFSDSPVPIEVCEMSAAIAGSSCCPVISGAPAAADTSPRILAPTCVPLSGAAAITAGGAHSCAVMINSGILCWGENSSGQIGDSTHFDRPVPVAVCQAGLPIAGASGVSLPACCPIVAGQGSPAGILSCLPLLGVTSITAGAEHTCAILEDDDAVMCWGRNYSGQLGDGTVFERSLPIHVCVPSPIIAGVPPSCAGLTGGVNVSAGFAHTCAHMHTGLILCWGGNSAGKLGNGTNDDSGVPVAVVGFVAKPTPTRTNTATRTATAPPGSTPTLTSSPTPTNTPTRTPTSPPGATNTSTRTPASPAATNTPTRTPTPPSGGPLGDVNCDGRADAIDAALVLQLSAGIINSLPCPQNGDLNSDTRTNPIDAALILQFVAGLIAQLP